MWEEYDTTATDLELMRESLGPTAERVGVSLDIRKDIERFVVVFSRLLGN
ncbi:MAG: hypothetical protein WD273_05565 [Trueperaceae bacterium]